MGDKFMFIMNAAVIGAGGLEKVLREERRIFFSDGDNRTVIFNIPASDVKALCREKGITDFEFMEFGSGDIPEALLGFAQAADEFYRSCLRERTEHGFSDSDIRYFISESIDEQISCKYRYYARMTATGGKCL